MLTVRQALVQARQALEQALGLDRGAASLEAHLLLGQALGRPRAWLLAHPEQGLDESARAAFEGLLARRRQGEPVAYLLGRREFFGLDLRVTRDVLIPRPETELLVELALAHLPPEVPAEVLDLGTGSGAIALALAHARPAARLTAIDRSARALAVARDNARRLGLERVRFLEGDWFSPLPAGMRFDLIVANPPYVAVGDPHLAEGDLRFEPATALVGGADGLAALSTIIAQAGQWLAPGGSLWLEHGYDQAAPCRSLLERAGFEAVASHRDLAGQERVSGGRWPGIAAVDRVYNSGEASPTSP